MKLLARRLGPQSCNKMLLEMSQADIRQRRELRTASTQAAVLHLQSVEADLQQLAGRAQRASAPRSEP